MQQVEVTTSELHLSKLAEQVEQGEQIILTRAGSPIARIIPEPGLDATASELTPELTPEQQASARAASQRIRERARRLKLGPFDLEQFKRDRDEGRR